MPVPYSVYRFRHGTWLIDHTPLLLQNGCYQAALVITRMADAPETVFRLEPEVAPFALEREAAEFGLGLALRWIEENRSA